MSPDLSHAAYSALKLERARMHFVPQEIGAIYL
ncbi:hypothetical protein SAMN04489710_111161 [Paracidovorax konjaci]|uniref:Uncharacterized protein n=1 Tax=Paracidovorax konjaci TaxID=32040 RepID=A0A1I1X1W0_9BURK|nr:hypothetical protein SAMN04489710_111161 [Paracidovorax konjaci]